MLPFLFWSYFRDSIKLTFMPLSATQKKNSSELGKLCDLYEIFCTVSSGHLRLDAMGPQFFAPVVEG